MAQARTHVVTTPFFQSTLADTVTDLRTQRAELVAEIAKFNEELVVLTRRFDEQRKAQEKEYQETEKRRSLVAADLQQLQGEVFECRQAIETLTPRRRTLEADVDEKKRQAERHAKEIRELRESLEEYDKQISQARDLWRDLVTRLDFDTQKLEETQKLIAELESKRVESVSIQKTLDKLRIEEQELGESVRRAREDELCGRTRLTSITKELEERQREELEITRSRNGAEIELARLRLEKDNLSAINVGLVKDNDRLQSNIQHLTAEKINLEKEVSVTVQKLRTYQASVEPVKEALQAQERELARVNNEVASTRGLLKELADKSLERERKLENLLLQINEANGDIQRAEVLLGKHRSEDEQLQTQLAERKLGLQKIDEDIRVARQELIDIQHRCDHCQETEEERRKKIAQIDKEIQTREHDLATFEVKKRQAEENEKTLLEGNEMLTRKQRLLVGEIENLQHELDALQKSIAEAKLRLQNAVEERRRVRANIEELEGTLAARRNESAGLDTEIQSREAKMRNLKEMLAAVQARVEESRAEYAQEQEQKRVLLIQKKALGAEVEAAQEALRDTEEEEKTLQLRISDIKKNQREAEAALHQLELQQTSAIDHLNSLRAEMVRIEENRKAAETKAAATNQKILRLEQVVQEGLRKKQTLAGVLRKEIEAIRQARVRLTELESLRDDKVKEIDELRNAVVEAPVVDNTTAGEKTRNPYYQVRADAERTLENLRRRLQQANTNSDKKAD